MRKLISRFERWGGSALASLLPPTALHALADRLAVRNPKIILETLGPRLNRDRNLDNMPFDLSTKTSLGFEHLSGLFASTSLDHAVIAMPIRQTAYLFGLVRQMNARSVIEIGRYKGGSTLAIAAAMQPDGQFWSIDLGEKEDRLFKNALLPRPFDQQISNLFDRLGLKATLIVGDSRTIDIETGEVDLVFIDGDHSYEGVKNDFERFGRRVRIGGAVLFDDVFDDGLFKTHSDTVGRLVREIIQTNEFQLVKNVNRLAHLERIR